MKGIADLIPIKKSILEGGGRDKIKKVHESGKLTARERIEKLFDPKTFVEVGVFANHANVDSPFEKFDAPCDGVVTGYGTIGGRLAYAYAQDFTVLDGSLGENHAKKICKCLDLAKEMGAPVVGLLDSNGARMNEGLNSINGYAQIVRRCASIAGVVPQINLILGGSYASQAIFASLGDIVLTTEKNGKLFMHGETVIGANSAKEDDNKNYAAYVAKSEEECIERAKLLISYLPSNYLDDSHLIACTDDLNRMEVALDSVVPQDDSPFDIIPSVEAICDVGSFIPLYPHYAANVIIGLARMDGATIGVVANQSLVNNGEIDTASARKTANFVRFCNSFSLPILTLTDVGGFVIDAKQENAGLAQAVADMSFAYASATVPKVGLVVRRAYGGAYLASGFKDVGADVVFAWPTARISIMPAESAVNILFEKEMSNVSDPVGTRQQLIDKYHNELASPLDAAKKGYVDNIIEPSLTRSYVASAFLMLSSKRR